MTVKQKRRTDYIFFKQTIFKSNFLTIQATSILLVIYLIAMGGYLIHSGSYLFEYKERIDHDCIGEVCNVRMRVDKELLSKPLYLYIAYEGFYLNHRKVMYSIDYDQLSGKEKTKEDLKTNCENYLSTADLKRFHPDVLSEEDYGETVVNPCGLFPFLYTQCKINR